MRVRLWKDRDGDRWLQRGEEIALVPLDTDYQCFDWEGIEGAVEAYGLRPVRWWQR